nr:glycerophosphodiester phosphodiesterase family protein [Erythrobacter crassostrea]
MHGKGVPENSLAAAEAAIAAGMGIECDIQRSANGDAIVFHDWETDRLTGVRGATTELSTVALKELTYHGTEESPATLPEFLSAIGARVPLLIEIKSRPGYDVEATCEAVKDALADYLGDHSVMSFDPAVVIWFRKHSPATCAGLVMREDEHGYTQTKKQRLDAFNAAKPDFLAYHIAALPNDWVMGLRQSGLPILSWTVNSSETRKLALANVDALVSEGNGLP